MSRPIRIGLIAEGEAELGPSIPYISPQDGGKAIDRSQEGALHTLIRRELIAAGYLDCEFVQRHPSLNETRKGKRRTGHGILNRKYIAQVVSVWKPNEIDMVVILVDSDDELAQRTRDLNRAIEAVRQNHFDEHDQLIPNRNAGGLAIKNFDTWLLTDNDTIRKLLGTTLPDDLPHNLETLPGDRQAERCAKVILDKIIDQSEYLAEEADGLRKLKVRWELAGIIHLPYLSNRCQQGYKTFIAAVGQAANEVQLP